jgi:hypothetical protein
LRTKNNPEFAAALDAYSVAAETAASSPSWTDRLGSWPVYAAATGSALALGTSAAASIIYFGAPLAPVSAAANVYATADFRCATVSMPPFAYPYLSAIHFNSAAYRVGFVGASGRRHTTV